ncbi:hypothetical protein WOLCODRAFT_22111 [Wolfiporia cocos MD-104 SS10]|uniref:DH domain-containing protein n=1 Tax=Wolfiporia cocos (strain MD-104) TaxID=742152 RepID=A0A2H3IW11_WOLCO|nr:hypothetical protein WOLCODRAFT_22111 [Wolfiporia cocos MD-104 SS10]
MLPGTTHDQSADAAADRSDSPTLGHWGGSAKAGPNDDRDSIDYPLPSPYTSRGPGTLDNTRATTPSRSILATHDDWSSDHGHPSSGVSPSSAYIVDSPLSMHSPTVNPRMQNFFERSAPEDDSLISDPALSHSSARSPVVPAALPDPSQFPDPYPYHPPRRRHGSSTPALSYEDTSSASTRSSAYTSSARSGDYGNVHIVSGDDSRLSAGIDMAQYYERDGVSASVPHGKAPYDQSRWSDLIANGVRSRSSSVGNGRPEPAETGFRPLRGTPSFDVSWQTVDERDENGVGSEDENTDDNWGDDDDQLEEEEEPTSAAVMIAEEGRGIIVRGDDAPIVRLQVKPGTTHLLIGSSGTPNAVPSFLTSTLPQIADTLLALDISANFLVALPPALSACVNLEELNIASNPLRALPEFLSELISLRVLIVDSTSISSLPESLCALDKMHTLSIRRNKLNSLPSWLCLLPSLEILLVDGNPFHGPWEALVKPLLSQAPITPIYPPSTPTFPPPTSSVVSMLSAMDGDDAPEQPWAEREDHQQVAAEEEDTITPARAANLTRSATSPPPVPPAEPPTSPKLTRTRTTPNRAHFEKTKSASRPPIPSGEPGSSRPPSSHKDTHGQDGPGNREVRKMKSAGELRRNGQSKSAASSPQRSAMSEYVTSESSSSLLNAAATAPLPRDAQTLPKRFASLGVASGSSSHGNRPRLNTDASFWENSPNEDDDDDDELGKPMARRATMPREHPQAVQGAQGSPNHNQLPTPPREEKTRRWGFLKKMSMGKMRSDSVVRPPQGRPQGVPYNRQPLSRTNSTNPTPGIPQIDVRISTTGALLNQPNHSLPPTPPDGLSPLILMRQPSMEMTPPQVPEKFNLDALKIPNAGSSQHLAPAPTPRAAKRRSFLPIDMSPIPIPAASSFVPGVTATNSTEDLNDTDQPPPVPVPKDPYEEIQRREEERAREVRLRALRSVMAYLRDMHDLGLSQANIATLEPPSGLRSRRPTMVESRLPSESSISSLSSSPSILSRPDSMAQSRFMDSRVVSRAGSTIQTNSVATSDSSGSGNGEERKYKNDRVKRAKIIREIVETERTYVKGLQELVDIYIEPAKASVNVLSGVGQRQESVVPSQERKIVFAGLEALFTFHKESFLQSLERACAPILVPAEDLVLQDADGYLSLDVAMKVAQIFVSHAAFMKMYSTYINNFDNSVQRIKSWTSDSRPPTASDKTLSPSASSAHLVGLGITMTAAGAPGVMPDNVQNTATLSSGQRKRIKAYLKRCRMNPRHSQLNLEGYLLLPVQRIPRYRMLLEELVKSSPPMYDYMDDPLERALAEISSLANNMNEGKRESESRRKLVQWQSRIRGRFPSPLVQPHRRLIMDGPLRLTRVVRKATVPFEYIDQHGDNCQVPVECLAPELTPRALIGILCNDLLVLCRDPTEGQDPNSQVDLWAVLRMQTLPQPASIVHGNALRLVDNKAILYFEAPSPSDALNWSRAINLHIPASKA